ncbi:hypothetical protein MIR68_009243 [Amoeboaphelidium protococcarum]|nr:hypothetical protein MIR68_009243 [Amoeboaphelidium protococcarum]
MDIDITLLVALIALGVVIIIAFAAITWFFRSYRRRRHRQRTSSGHSARQKGKSNDSAGKRKKKLDDVSAVLAAAPDYVGNNRLANPHGSVSATSSTQQQSISLTDSNQQAKVNAVYLSNSQSVRATHNYNATKSMPQLLDANTAQNGRTQDQTGGADKVSRQNTKGDRDRGAKNLISDVPPMPTRQSNQQIQGNNIRPTVPVSMANSNSVKTMVSPPRSQSHFELPISSSQFSPRSRTAAEIQQKQKQQSAEMDQTVVGVAQLVSTDLSVVIEQEQTVIDFAQLVSTDQSLLQVHETTLLETEISRKDESKQGQKSNSSGAILNQSANDKAAQRVSYPIAPNSTQNNDTVVMSNQQQNLGKPKFPSMQHSSAASQFSLGGTVRSYQSTQYYQGTTTLNAALLNQPQPLALPGAILTDLQKDVKVVRQLTEGGSGALYIAEIVDNNLKVRSDKSQFCVVKILKEEEGMNADDLVNAFNHEVSVMWLFHLSPNIIHILGYSDSPKAMILKHYVHGSLHDVVHRTSFTDLQYSDPKWTPDMWLKLSKDICNGLQIIHGHNVTHNDIKCANVLIDLEQDQRTLRGVICDFGIACPIDPAFYGVKMFKKSEVIGASAPYCAPEMFVKLSLDISADQDDPKIAKAGDMYSVGVVMYEIMNRIIPWTELKVDYAAIEKAVMNGVRPHIRDEVQMRWQDDVRLASYVKLFQQLWDQNPLNRPDAQQALAILNAIAIVK